jgi:hypothetical protein
MYRQQLISAKGMSAFREQRRAAERPPWAQSGLSSKISFISALQPQL